jgi:DNA-binding transcriptional LysR family regulator
VHAGDANLDLTRREADIAIRNAPTTQPDLVCRKLVSAGWSAYAARSYVEARGVPAPITDLANHDVSAFNDSLSQVPGALWLEAHGKGARIAVVPCFLAEGEPTMVRLTDELLGSRDVVLVVHPDLARVARVRVVMDFIVERFARDARILSGTHP